jgi:hypothetical protein
VTEQSPSIPVKPSPTTKTGGHSKSTGGKKVVVVTVVDVGGNVVTVVDGTEVVVVDVLVEVAVMPAVQATIKAPAPSNRTGLSMDIQRLQTHARSGAP